VGDTAHFGALSAPRNRALDRIRFQIGPRAATKQNDGRKIAKVAKAAPPIVLFAVLAPRTLVLLGDTFHDCRSEGRLAAQDAARIAALARGRTLVWVIGNHDADGPRALPGEVADELVLGGLILRHEPQAGPQRGEVAGHLHPAAKIAAPRGTLRRRCFITDGERAVLPAFGAYAGGLNVLDAAFAGMFVRPPLTGALGTGRVRAIGWRRLAAD